MDSIDPSPPPGNQPPSTQAEPFNLTINSSNVPQLSLGAATDKEPTISVQEATSNPNHECSHKIFLSKASHDSHHQKRFAAYVRNVLRDKPIFITFLEHLRTDFDPLLPCAPTLTKTYTFDRPLKEKFKQKGITVAATQLYKSLKVRHPFEIFKKEDSEETFCTVYLRVVEKCPHSY